MLHNLRPNCADGPMALPLSLTSLSFNPAQSKFHGQSGFLRRTQQHLYPKRFAVEGRIDHSLEGITAETREGQSKAKQTDGSSFVFTSDSHTDIFPLQGPAGTRRKEGSAFSPTLVHSALPCRLQAL